MNFAEPVEFYTPEIRKEILDVVRSEIFCGGFRKTYADKRIGDTESNLGGLSMKIYGAKFLDGVDLQQLNKWLHQHYGVVVVERASRQGYFRGAPAITVYRATA